MISRESGKSIRDAGVNEDEFLAKLDEIAEEAFDDQCTGANPRYPLIAEIRQILLASYYGHPYTEEVDHSAKKAPGKTRAKAKATNKTSTKARRKGPVAKVRPKLRPAE